MEIMDSRNLSNILEEDPIESLSSYKMRRSAMLIFKTTPPETLETGFKLKNNSRTNFDLP